jgi:hypothetical protein
MVDLQESATADDVLTGYRTTELGLLPEDWAVVPLAQITQKTRQRNPALHPEEIIQYVDVSTVSSDQLRIVAPRAYDGC